MQKKIISSMIFAFIFLCIWILWSSNVEMNNTLLFKKNSYYVMQKYLLAPESEIICKGMYYLQLF